MKRSTLSGIILFFSLVLNLQAQSNRSWWERLTSKGNPETFTILKSEVQEILNYKVNEVLELKKNKYLNKSVLIASVQNGDMHFLRLKLNYFDNAYLTIQVNGAYSTQIFILSDDKSVSYKGKADGEQYLMSQCEADEIISE